jgi:hypothetical protein
MQTNHAIYRILSKKFNELSVNSMDKSVKTLFVISWTESLRVERVEEVIARYCISHLNFEP